MSNQPNDKKSSSARNGSSHASPPGEERDSRVKLPIRVLLVDNHTLVREALASLLALDPRVQIVGEAGSGSDALRLVSTLQPDIVLLDLSMPGIHGIDVIRQIRASHPAIKCLVLTVHLSEPIVRAALQAGAAGYLLKEASHTELKTAIYSVAQGQMYISPMIADKVISGYVGRRSSPYNEATPWQSLSEREREVLKLVAEGATNKAIGDTLCISVRTVEKHRASLMSKLNLKTTAALTAFAIKHELVTSSSVLKDDLLSDERS